MRAWSWLWPFSPEDGWLRFAEFAREAVAGEDGIGDMGRRQAIADAADGLGRHHASELMIERVFGDPARHQHKRVASKRLRPAGMNAGKLRRPVHNAGEAMRQEKLDADRHQPCVDETLFIGHLRPGR